MQRRDFVTQSVPYIGEHYTESLNGPEQLKLCRRFILCLHPSAALKPLGLDTSVHLWSNNMQVFLDKLMVRLHNRYTTIFSHYYPAHGSTGFTERNLTNNFVSALESLYPGSCFSWFEAPISLTEKKHMDAIVFTETELFLIEAKRFTAPQSKTHSVRNDIERMQSNEAHLLLEKGLINPIQRQRYAVILADVWTETKGKQDIFETWPTCLNSGQFLYSKVLEFSELPVEGEWKHNYKILVAVKELT